MGDFVPASPVADTAFEYVDRLLELASTELRFFSGDVLDERKLDLTLKNVEEEHDVIIEHAMIVGRDDSMGHYGEALDLEVLVGLRNEMETLPESFREKTICLVFDSGKEVAPRKVGILNGKAFAEFLVEDGDYDCWGLTSLRTSPVMAQLRDSMERGTAREGISWSDELVPATLQDTLLQLTDHLARNVEVDYHPGSNEAVRDLVHPSLYPFIRGETRFIDESVGEALLSEARSWRKDFWDRPFEDSKYQWLPAEVSTSAVTGACRFESYINNLDRPAFPTLYVALEELLSLALPRLERVYQYSLAHRFHEEGNESLYADEESVEGHDDTISDTLLGRRLQVVVKIVDYELRNGNTFSGVWHVEGMSHENIVATALYVADRSEDLQGGDLHFKRAFWAREVSRLFMEIAQCRPDAIETAIDEGMVPLGILPTPGGRLIVFPNSHVHRVSELFGTGRRRIIVFFLINPERRIPSSEHVAPQQFVMSREQAKEHRLKLMNERKYHKQDWNVREVELCEH